MDSSLEYTGADRNSPVELDKDVTPILQPTIERLGNYYVLNRRQARNAFVFSLSALILGLLVIITGIVLFLVTNINLSTQLIIFSSGIFLTLISIPYYYIYRKSGEQLKYFSTELEKMQNTLLALKLTEEIEDTSKRNELTQKLIVALLNENVNILKTISKSKNKQAKIK